MAPARLSRFNDTMKVTIVTVMDGVLKHYYSGNMTKHPAANTSQVSSTIPTNLVVSWDNLAKPRQRNPTMAADKQWPPFTASSM